MSQKKLSKKRQEELLKKQKQQKRLVVLMIAMVIVAFAGSIGWIAYDKHQKSKAAEEAAAKKKQEMIDSKANTDSSIVNVDALLEYLSGLDTELLNEEIVPSTAITQEAVSSDGALVH